MEDEKFKDLLEDEELTALRLAALASKKRNEQNLNKPGSAASLPIDSIVTAPNTSSELVSNQIPFVQSDRSAHNNYSWRKQNQSQRRRGGAFPKSHRSNLIVISPVSLNDGKDSEEKVPSLVLPQHKWCNSGNEDSMSPKTLRRTGPTRFNRHGSDSESSEDDSDYEPSDNDSGSNETILQDEPPEHFSRLSPGCDNLSDSVEKKRRLSFQSLDSDMKSETFDKNEATSVYKSLKSSLYSDMKHDKYAVQHLNDEELTFNNSDENKYSNCNSGHSYNTKPSDLSEERVFKKGDTSVGTAETCYKKANASLTDLSDTSKIWQDVDVNKSSAHYSKDPESSQNFRLSDGNHKDFVDKRQSLQTITDAHDSRKSVWKHTEGFRNENSPYPMETQHISVNSKTYNDDNKSHYLSENDLRLELKKRMQDMKSKTTCIEKNEIVENRTYPHYNTWDRSKQSYSHKSDNLSSVNSFGETRVSSFKQADRINQNISRDIDNVEHSSNFTRERSCRSISRERTTRERFPPRDGIESSFDRKRYDRSPSIGRDACSSSRSRRRERSSSLEEKRLEVSTGQSRIKQNSNDDKPGSSLSPCRNKFEHSYRYKSNDDRNVAEERRDWYKSSPREKPEWNSNQDRNKRGCSSSSESKRERSASRDRKFSHSSKNKQENNAGDKDRHYTQTHDKNRYENNLSRGRSKYLSNSRHDRSRRERSLSHDDRSRHESSRSLDSRSERSSSREKNRYSSSRERSKDEQSSSESESRYKCNSRLAYNTSKFPSDQYKSKHDIIVNQKVNVKENDSNQNMVPECNNLQNKLKCTLNSGKIKDELWKINTKDQSKSEIRNRTDRSNSKEKILSNRKPQEKYSRNKKNSYRKRYSRSRSSSSESCSSSYSSSSSHGSKPKIRSVPSVIKPVVVKSDTDNKGNLSESKSVGKSINSIAPQSSVHSVFAKRNLDNAEINKPSNFKCGRMDGDSKAPEGKRVPVHMRLGAFPRKRVIQMPKDVEAAFVNSSSSSDDENVSTKCKKQNIRIITDMYGAKNRVDFIQPKYSSDDKSAKRPSPDTYKEKFKRVKAHR